jgi:hypothetical protein
MCSKQEVPLCFGRMYSRKEADCMGSKSQEQCVLHAHCSRANRQYEQALCVLVNPNSTKQAQNQG